MTSQKELIIAFLQTHARATARIISDTLGINYNSVRGRLSELKNKGNVLNKSPYWKTSAKGERQDIPAETFRKIREIRDITPTIYYRKIVKSVYYFEGMTAHRDVRRFVFALTFENNLIDREPELIDAIEGRYGDKGYRTSGYGYSDSSTTTRPPFKWDIIETGEEK